jgi:hypothetical protein
LTDNPQALPAGAVHTRCDRGTDTGEEDTEDEDTAVVVYEAKQREKLIVCSIHSESDSYSQPESESERVARCLIQAEELMSKEANKMSWVRVSLERRTSMSMEVLLESD